MKQVIVFGSGGLAKELIDYLEDDGFEVLGAVSTEPFNNPRYSERFRVWDKAPEQFSSAAYVLGVSEPWIKRELVAKNADRWISYIHPSCTVSRYATIGKGCVLAPQAIVVGDAVLGDFIFMDTNATVGHDSVIGSFGTLFPNTEVCGNCLIGEDSIFGIGSYALPNVTLPAQTKVSAGAVVRKSVFQSCTLYGDPAKPLIKAE